MSLYYSLISRFSFEYFNSYPDLKGRIQIIPNIEQGPNMTEIEQLFPDLLPGGRFAPRHCISRHRVAIIVPYRDRPIHLQAFLVNIHTLLHRQELGIARQKRHII